MRFLIIFIFLTTNVFANDVSEIKNVVIHKDPKVYDNVIFLDKKDKRINLNEFNGNLILLNFWATWCEPCKEEMPSLDRLQINEDLSNLKVFVINISKESINKIDSFFNDLNIKNLEPYFDAPTTLAKTFGLRGVPTSILIDKDGNEIWNDNELGFMLTHIDQFGRMYGCSNTDAPNNNGMKINMDLDILWSAMNGEVDFHEYKQIPNGNYMGFVRSDTLGPIPSDNDMTDQFRSLGYLADDSTDEFTWYGQMLIEWDINHNIVWSWNPFEHFKITFSIFYFNPSARNFNNFQI